MGSSRAHSKPRYLYTYIRVKAGGFRKDETSYDNAKTNYNLKNSLQ